MTRPLRIEYPGAWYSDGVFPDGVGPQRRKVGRDAQRFGGEISITVFGWQFAIDANNCKISSAKLRVLRASAFKSPSVSDFRLAAKPFPSYSAFLITVSFFGFDRERFNQDRARRCPSGTCYCFAFFNFSK